MRTIGVEYFCDKLHRRSSVRVIVSELEEEFKDAYQLYALFMIHLLRMDYRQVYTLQHPNESSPDDNAFPFLFIMEKRNHPHRCYSQSAPRQSQQEDLSSDSSNRAAVSSLIHLVPTSAFDIPFLCRKFHTGVSFDKRQAT